MFSSTPVTMMSTAGIMMAAGHAGRSSTYSNYYSNKPTPEQKMQDEQNAEQQRLVAYEYQRDLIPRVHASTFDQITKEIYNCASLRYPISRFYKPGIWPIPLVNDLCLFDVILTHSQLSDAQKIELTGNIFNIHPAYTDILYKDSVVDLLLNNPNFHDHLKQLYLTTCINYSSYSFKAPYEKRIWDLLIQESIDNLSVKLKPLLDRVSEYNPDRAVQSRLLRCALNCLDANKSSEEIIDTYAKIKAIFSPYPKLNKYCTYLHKVAEMRINQKQSQSENLDNKDKVFSFLGDNRCSLFKCCTTSKAQDLNNQLRNKEVKAADNLASATSEVENELNGKFSKKFGITTKFG